MEQMLEQLTSFHGENQGIRVMPGEVVPSSHSGGGMTGLAGPMASLTSSIQSLTKLQEEAHADMRRTMLDLPGVIRHELQVSLHELTDTIIDLTKVVKNVSSHNVPVEQGSHSRRFLWKAPADLSVSSDTNLFEKTKSWPRWPRIPTQRRTG